MATDDECMSNSSSTCSCNQSAIMPQLWQVLQANTDTYTGQLSRQDMLLRTLPAFQGPVMCPRAPNHMAPLRSQSAFEPVTSHCRGVTAQLHPTDSRSNGHQFNQAAMVTNTAAGIWIAYPSMPAQSGHHKTCCSGCEYEQSRLIALSGGLLVLQCCIFSLTNWMTVIEKATLLHTMRLVALSCSPVVLH